MAYTTINKSTDYFNTKLYTGNGTDNHAITGVGFQPDFIWVKARSSAKEHRLQNAVSGITNHMRSNATNAESAGSVKTADSDGFTLGTGASWNENSTTFASWNWLANGAGSSNTDGSINSTVSANTTAGFSIVSYTGTGSVATVGHGLGVAPNIVIVKQRTVAGNHWVMYNSALPSANYFLYLDSTDAQQTATNFFNDTAPTSSVFTIGTDAQTNGNTNNLIAYCFAEKTGYSKFGTYTGNGSSDGTFVFLGFKPAFVIAKKTNSTGNWVIVDNKRDGYNGANDTLQANVTDVESGGNRFDIYSNGFKARSTSSYSNSTGDTFIYMAFGQSLVSSNNVPCTAR